MLHFFSLGIQCDGKGSELGILTTIGMGQYYDLLACISQFAKVVADELRVVVYPRRRSLRAGFIALGIARRVEDVDGIAFLTEW